MKNPLENPLILVAIGGLVEFYKRLGLSGNWLIVSSMMTGVVLTILGSLAELYPEINPAFQIILGGILAGLATCGAYDFTTKNMDWLKSLVAGLWNRNDGQR